MVESVNAWRGVIRCIINCTCNLLMGFTINLMKTYLELSRVDNSLQESNPYS